MNRLAIWLQAARPKTLIASIAPVILGATTAWPTLHVPTLLWTLIAALAIQIGTNFSNDYFDFVKGADTEKRKGPLRVTSAGLVSPKQMKQAIFLMFACVFVICLYLTLRGGIAIFALSIVAITLGLAYTAGPVPLAYLGLGDLFVLVFFGPIATVGAYYLQTGAFDTRPVWLGWGCGLISTAILTINNLRDIEEDRQANKKTLCVRLGPQFGQWEYRLCLAFPLLIAIMLHHYLAASILTLPAFALMWQSHRCKSGTEWNRQLAQTGQFLMLYTVSMFL